MYRSLRPSTEDGYQKIINVLIKTYPNLRPEEMTVEKMLEWRTNVLKTAKPITWNTYARHMRSLYNFGIENELLHIEKNPFSKSLIREDKAKLKTLTKEQLEEINNLLHSPENLPGIFNPRWFSLALINMFRYTGIRRSQLIQLRICDIDLTRKTIDIPSNINKNHNNHQIPISKKLFPYIQKLVFEMKTRCDSDQEQLFNINKVCKSVRDKHRSMTKDQVSYIMAMIGDRVGFYVSSHRFRHTIATELMKNVDNVYSVQKLLGHSDIKVTLGYIQYDCEMIRDCIDTL